MNFLGKKNKKLIVGFVLIASLFSIFPANILVAQTPQQVCDGAVGASGTCYQTGTQITSTSVCRDLGGSFSSQQQTCFINGAVVYTVSSNNQLARPSGETVPADPKVEKGICGIELMFVNIGDLVCGIVVSVMMVPIALSAFLLFLASFILDFVINQTVLNMSPLIDSVSGINVAWSLIRDLINISFIFILLYSAIKTILGTGGELMKKTIIGVVIAAVLINFSLFFAKIVIDASNLVALTFHNAIVSSCDPSGAGSLSKCFTQPMGITTIYNPSDAQQFLQDLGYNFGKVGIVSIVGSIFILITTFVFLAVAVMFIIRFVVIIFLLILSPVGIVGVFIPEFKKQSQDWVNKMTDQALFAPVFMIMVWVTASILNSEGFRFAGGSIADSFKGDASLSTAQIIFKFIVAIALIIATLTISKGFSKQGGALGGAFAGKIVGGTTGWAGRQAIGRLGNRISRSSSLNRLANREGVAGIIGRRALRGTTKVAKGSYDFRATGLGKTLGAGAPSKGGGFAERRDAEEKERIQAGERVRINELERTVERGTADGATDTEIEAMERALARASAKEVEEIAAGNKELLSIRTFAENISVQQLEAIEKSDKFSEAEKDTIKAARFAEAATITAGAPGVIRPPGLPPTPVTSATRDRIRNLSDRELELINPDDLLDPGFVEFLRPNQVDTIMRSSKFTARQKEGLRRERERPLSAALDVMGPQYDPDRARNIVSRMSPAAVAALNASTLTNPQILPTLSVNKLRRMAREIDNPQTISNIRNAIISMRTAIATGTATGYTPEQQSQITSVADWLETGNGRNEFA